MRIFEARYLDMVSQCLQHDSGFGVCLIRHGREVGESASTENMGVVARITDWHQRHDGLLGITTVGEQRFRIASVRVQDNQLAVARVELLGSDPSIELPDKYLPLVDMLMRLIESAGHHYASVPRHYADASWVSYRLVELLPIEMPRKQLFLEMDDPLARLEELYRMLEGMQVV